MGCYNRAMKISSLKGSGAIRTAALACALAALAGCSHEAADWQAATNANTVAAYQHFVGQYPKSAHDADAQTRIAQLQEAQDWQTATGADTRQAYEQYLSQHPDGPNAQEARIRIENFAQAASAAGAAGAAGAAAAAPPTAAKPRTESRAQAATPKPARGKAPRAVASGGEVHYVQLGAFHSRAHAEHHWKELTRRFGHDLAGLTPRYVTGKSHAAPVVRLQVALSSRAQAQSLCAKLRAHAQACVAARSR